MIVEMSGEKFGRLTAISVCSHRNKFNQIMWECQCECGNKCEVTGQGLRRGSTRSCGCLRNDLTKARMSGDSHPRWGGGERTFGSMSWAKRLLKTSTTWSIAHGHKPPAITAEQYMELAGAYDGRCGICGRETKTPCLDHCHKTGVVRGFLCRFCNSFLGFFRHDKEILQKSIDWLDKDAINDATLAEGPRQVPDTDTVGEAGAAT